MAYTYEDFIKAANQNNMLGEFSPEEMELSQKNPEYGLGLLSIKKDYKAADTNEQRLLLNEAANQLRQSFSPTLPGELKPQAEKNPFQYDREGEYKKLLDDTLNQGSFEWNPDTDRRWQSFQKSYRREGERAQANALAEAAANTGGRASSHAVSAAGQAGNYYAAQLMDALPKVYGEARREYSDDYAQKLRQLEALRQDKADAYNVYLDQLNEAFRQDQAAKAEEQRKFQNALTFYRQFGYATPEVAEILGIPAVNPNQPSYGGYGGGGEPKKEDSKVKEHEITDKTRRPVSNAEVESMAAAMRSGNGAIVNSSLIDRMSQEQYDYLKGVAIAIGKEKAARR